MELLIPILIILVAGTYLSFREPQPPVVSDLEYKILMAKAQEEADNLWDKYQEEDRKLMQELNEGISRREWKKDLLLMEIQHMNYNASLPESERTEWPLSSGFKDGKIDPERL